MFLFPQQNPHNLTKLQNSKKSAGNDWFEMCGQDCGQKQTLPVMSLDTFSFLWWICVVGNTLTCDSNGNAHDYQQNNTNTDGNCKKTWIRFDLSPDFKAVRKKSLRIADGLGTRLFHQWQISMDYVSIQAGMHYWHMSMSVLTQYDSEPILAVSFADWPGPKAAAGLWVGRAESFLRVALPSSLVGHGQTVHRVLKR